MAIKLRAALSLIVTLAGILKPSVRARAGAVVLAGAALLAYGTAAIYVPAGEIVGGLELALFGLLFVEVGTRS